MFLYLKDFCTKICFRSKAISFTNCFLYYLLPHIVKNYNFLQITVILECTYKRIQLFLSDAWHKCEYGITNFIVRFSSLLQAVTRLFYLPINKRSVVQNNDKRIWNIKEQLTQHLVRFFLSSIVIHPISRLLAVLYII